MRFERQRAGMAILEEQLQEQEEAQAQRALEKRQVESLHTADQGHGVLGTAYLESVCYLHSTCEISHGSRHSSVLGFGIMSPHRLVSR